MVWALDHLYLPDDRDRKVFGDRYAPPDVFEHGKWHQVAVIPKTYPDSDGYEVAIDECRMPARFFRLRPLASTNSMGQPNPIPTYLSTGSGDEMGCLVLQIAKALSDGMLGFDAPEVR